MSRIETQERSIQISFSEAYRLKESANSRGRKKLNGFATKRDSAIQV
jgi:hypothetical protein